MEEGLKECFVRRRGARATFFFSSFFSAVFFCCVLFKIDVLRSGFFLFSDLFFNPPATVPLVQSTLEWSGDEVTEEEERLKRRGGNLDISTAEMKTRQRTHERLVDRGGRV